ncbi:MAG TPA: hypothetical protein VM165_02325, partial [Planctomycetaceae bacterium]|nr:hypothetical protein [Planctomycetaceae bacterium]
MRSSWKAILTFVVVAGCASADAAIINAANPRRAKTGATVRITTTTSGQRMILLKIDPGVTTAFQLDVLYP